MSAAGLGLSWSGAAFASRHNNTAAGSSLTFGVAPRGEETCNAKSPDGWASCPSAQGELLRQIVAKTAALTLPLAAIAPASDHKVTPRVLDAFAATSGRQTVTARTTPNTSSGESEPGDEIPFPEAPVAARVTDGPVLDRLADAFTMLVVDGRPGLAADRRCLGSAIMHDRGLCMTATTSHSPAAMKSSNTFCLRSNMPARCHASPYSPPPRRLGCA